MPSEKAETTHYSVADGEGNAVAVTYTINGYFGAAVVQPGTGFFLNNEMDDFAVKPGTPNLYGLVQGEPNAIAPGKRPLSSMAPTLVEKVWPGGPRARQPGPSAHHRRRARDDNEHRRLRHVPAGGGRCSSAAPSMAAARDFFRTRRITAAEVIEQLSGMSYKLVEQKPWGAVELIQLARGRFFRRERPSTASRCGARLLKVSRSSPAGLASSSP